MRFFLLVFVILPDNGLEFLQTLGDGYFDLVGSFLVNSPNINDVRETGPVNLGDILDTQ